MLLTGQEISRRGDLPGARKIYLDFAQAAPDAPLLPELQLAVAATYEQEKKWAEAIAQYDSLAGEFHQPTRPGRARSTIAPGTSPRPATRRMRWRLFTNFVARFPTNELAPLAQLWVADYYYDAGDPVEAERNYKLLFQNTNWAPSELTYWAQTDGRARRRGPPGLGRGQGLLPQPV